MNEKFLFTWNYVITNSYKYITCTKYLNLGRWEGKIMCFDLTDNDNIFNLKKKKKLKN